MIGRLSSEVSIWICWSQRSHTYVYIYIYIHNGTQKMLEWKVNSSNLKPLYIAAKSLLEKINMVTLGHVKRDKNKIADKLANKAMDE